MPGDEKLGPCNLDCPAIRDGGFEVAAGESVFVEYPDSFRILSVFAEGNTAGFTDEEISVSPLRHKVEECQGKLESQERIRREGLAGLLGLKKTVTVQRCPALNSGKVI